MINILNKNIINLTKIHAFTLAEVLITLGIIGVVAAMTLPTVVQNYQKQATVSRIKKFYTTINQAVERSENDYGSCYTWDLPIDNNGTTDDALEFFNKYLATYMKITEIKKERVMRSDQSSAIYQNFIRFADGTGMSINWSSGLDISFYPFTNDVFSASKKTSKYKFSFSLLKVNSYGDKCKVEPYSFTWKGTREDLKNSSRYGCRTDSPTNAFCTKLIQYDGWKISDDYPW